MSIRSKSVSYPFALVKKVTKLACAATLMLGLGSAAQAASVTVVADVNATSSGNNAVYLNVLGSSTDVLFSRSVFQQGAIHSLYGAQPGVTSTASAATLTSSLLASYDLLVMTQSFNFAMSYTGAELAAVNGFVAGGGDVLFVAESSNASVLAGYNAILAGIGSSISYTGDRFCSGGHDPSLAPSPISSPSDGFHVICHNSLTGGTSVGEDTSGRTFLAYEGDLGGVPAVPLPASGLLLFGGLMGVFGLRRRTR